MIRKPQQCVSAESAPGAEIIELFPGCDERIPDVPNGPLYQAWKRMRDAEIQRGIVPLKTLAEVEAEHIDRVLSVAPSKGEAAKILGIDPATLYRKTRERETAHEQKQ